MAESPQNHIQTTCPKCAAHLQAPVKSIGQQLPCPKCGHQILVTAPAASSTLRETHTYVAPPSTDDEYAVREMPPADVQHSGPVTSVGMLPEDLAGDELRDDELSSKIAKEVMLPSERPKLPARPMVDGVFTFFWQTAAAIFWSAASLGATIACWFMWQALAVGGFVVLATAGPSSGLSAAAGAISSLVLALMSGTMSTLWLIVVSGFFLAILQDSAAGNRIVHNWPELNLLDWLGSAIYLVVSLLMPVGAAYALAWPLGGLFSHLWLVPICLWLLFPVVMLSALEAASPLMPFSPMVLRSLVKCTRTWAVFYLETALLGIGMIMLTAALAILGVIEVGVTLLAGSGVACAMLYFRLLGRLAWVCDDYFREYPVKKEKDADDMPEEEDMEDNDAPEIRPTPVNDF